MTQVILLILGFAVIVPSLTWKLVHLPDPRVAQRWREMARAANDLSTHLQKVGAAAHEVSTHLRYFAATWRAGRATSRDL